MTPGEGPKWGVAWLYRSRQSLQIRPSSLEISRIERYTMIRFANPGSDISGFTRIYQALFEELSSAQPFSLDDMTAALIRRNLVTSSGYTGKEALLRSTRTDRSRDPLYNQSKMYSELFRLLGWLHPTTESRQRFVFTWLGAHVAAAGPHAKPLVRECVLGIAFPNEIVAARGDHNLRPFALILKTMSTLEGLLCRDEMIVGPLSLTDDTDPKQVAAMTARISQLRKSGGGALTIAVETLAEKQAVQVNTMENYTRFPLAVLEWSGWTEKARVSGLYGKPVVFHRLTPAGKQKAAALSGTQDFRLAAVGLLPKQQKESLAKLGAVSMLERAGFNSVQLQPDRDNWVAQLLASGLVETGTTPILFSPFQEMSPSDTEVLFGGVGSRSSTTTDAQGSVERPTSSIGRAIPQATPLSFLKEQPVVIGDDDTSKFIARRSAAGASPQQVAEELVTRLEAANKSEFYPTIASLFKSIGYDCTTSRVGVNYERWDAFIRHPTQSVPIEIKSPGEERHISVKGVRQALENKIILLSRKSAPTTRETTSLVVGYLAPSQRAEVSDLVLDIHTAFGISIGVIDLFSLSVLACKASAGAAHDSATLLTLRGFLSVATP
jgi:hypothetical protein